MRHHRRTTLLALACGCAAACGGSGAAASSSAPPARGPVIDTAVASALASQADAVAANLDAHHGCAARSTARQLVASVDAAVRAGQIPAALRPQLQASAAALAAEIRCAPRHRFVPPGHRHHHARGHGDGQDGQGQAGE